MPRLFIIFAATYLFFVVALLGIVAWWQLPRRQKFQLAVQAFMAAVLAYVFTHIAGGLHQDIRPFVAQHFTPLVPHAADNGFPSEHTTYSMLIAFVVLPYAKKWGWILSGLAAIVGLGRIGAGVHSPQDIVGGIVVAVLAAGISYYAAKRLVTLWQHRSKAMA